MNKPGTMRHESGHKAFWLAEEYCCNGGYYSSTPYPNLWKKESAAKTAAKSFGKPGSSAKQLSDGTQTIKWWKICDSSCQMNDGLTTPVKAFDTPCLQRVRYVIVDTVTKP